MGRSLEAHVGNQRHARIGVSTRSNHTGSGTKREVGNTDGEETNPRSWILLLVVAFAISFEICLFKALTHSIDKTLLCGRVNKGQPRLQQ